MILTHSDEWTPEALARTGQWSAEDWRHAYNAYGWRADWAAWATFINRAGHHPNALFAFDPLLIDERMPPGEWRIENRATGDVLHSSSPLPPSGDLIERIDAAIEAWECNEDAYRWIPEWGGANF